jgi:hypothetical protein
MEKEKQAQYQDCFSQPPDLVKLKVLVVLYWIKERRIVEAGKSVTGKSPT